MTELNEWWVGIRITDNGMQTLARGVCKCGVNTSSWIWPSTEGYQGYHTQQRVTNWIARHFQSHCEVYHGAE